MPGCAGSASIGAGSGRRDVARNNRCRNASEVQAFLSNNAGRDPAVGSASRLCGHSFVARVPALAAHIVTSPDAWRSLKGQLRYVRTSVKVSMCLFSPNWHDRHLDVLGEFALIPRCVDAAPPLQRAHEAEAQARHARGR